jgi:hypothetical protein
VSIKCCICLDVLSTIYSKDYLNTKIIAVFVPVALKALNPIQVVIGSTFGRPVVIVFSFFPLLSIVLTLDGRREEGSGTSVSYVNWCV